MLSLRILIGSKHQKVHNTLGVTPFVIVPSNEFDEVGIQSDTSLSIEDGGSGFSDEVSGDNFFITIGKNTLNKIG